MRAASPLAQHLEPLSTDSQASRSRRSHRAQRAASSHRHRGSELRDQSAQRGESLRGAGPFGQGEGLTESWPGLRFGGPGSTVPTARLLSKRSRRSVPSGSSPSTRGRPFEEQQTAAWSTWWNMLHLGRREESPCDRNPVADSLSFGFGLLRDALCFVVAGDVDKHGRV